MLQILLISQYKASLFEVNLNNHQHYETTLIHSDDSFLVGERNGIS